MLDFRDKQLKKRQFYPADARPTRVLRLPAGLAAGLAALFPAFLGRVGQPHHVEGIRGALGPDGSIKMLTLQNIIS